MISGDDLSPFNEDVLKSLEENKDLEFANKMMQDAYLLMHELWSKCLTMPNSIFEFSCLWCKGCRGCANDKGECSKNCLHGDNCDISEFLEKLEANAWVERRNGKNDLL